MNVDLVTPLATFLGLIVAAIIGILAWDYQVRKKKEIDLRIETFNDILELTNSLISPVNLNKFNELKDKVRNNLMICGNKKELDLYKDFVTSFRLWQDNINTPDEKKYFESVNKKLGELQWLVILVLRKEIGKKKLTNKY